MKLFPLFYAGAAITLLSIVWGQIIAKAMCEAILDILITKLFKSEYEHE